MFIQYMYNIFLHFQTYARQEKEQGKEEGGGGSKARRSNDGGAESVGTSCGGLIGKRTIELVGNKLFSSHPPVCCRLLFIIWVPHGERCKCRKRPEESPCPLFVHDLVPAPIAHPPSLVVLDLKDRQGVDESSPGGG